jgi:predicted metal-dependent phosphoesterase TrpH
MGGAELHAHTTESDGTFSPAEAVDQAASLGLEALAITDHDSMGAVPAAVEHARGTGVRIIPGVEISCLHRGGPVHLLGYWPDPRHEELAAELGRIRESRHTRAARMVEMLRALGHPIELERVLGFARGGSPGRPHLAQALVEAGVVRTVNDAFVPELIGTGGRAYVEKYCLEPERAVRLVRAAAGAAVLAHPGLHRGSRPVPDDLIRRLAEAGMAGLEADHIDHLPEQAERFRALADELGLVATAGSDCHGTLYDPVRMGTCRASLDTVEDLEARAGKHLPERDGGKDRGKPQGR